MSGKDSIRGYVYQTITSVLGTFSNTKWDFCHVEPNTKNDKADVLFYRGDNIMLAQQVKSSINPFNKKSIESWIYELINDVDNAESYELTLIGNCDKTTNDFVKKVNSHEISMDGHPGKVKISIQPLDEGLLLDSVENKLNKFFSDEGYTLKHVFIENLAKTLLYSFFQFSIIDEKISHEGFRNQLLNWARAILPKELKPKNTHDFVVYAYDKSSSEFVESIAIERTDLGLESYLDNLLKDAKICFENVKKIKLNTRNEQPTKIPTTAIAGLSRSYDDLLPKNDLDFDKNDASVLKKLIEMYLGEIMEPSFFNLGNLKYTISAMGFNIFGSVDEKKKYDFLYELLYQLQLYNDIYLLDLKIRDYVGLPLVLSNEGHRHDEEVEITFAVPATASVLTSEFVPQMTSKRALTFLLDNEVLHQSFCLGKNHLIDSYPYSMFPIDLDYHPLENLPFTNTDYKYERMVANYQRLMGQFFDFETLYNGQGFQSIRYRFPNINPNVRIAFPGLLFIRPNTDQLEISYTVRSKYSSDINAKTIEVKILN